MKKYYKIPLTERIAKINDISLFDILKDNYPDLYNREKGRVELQYGGDNPGVMTPQLEEAVKDYNQETDLMYASLGVPKYIIAVSNDDEVKEYATGAKIEMFGYGCVLQGREVPQTQAYEYLDKAPNYVGVVNNLFAKEEKKELKKTRFQRVVAALTGSKDN